MQIKSIYIYSKSGDIRTLDFALGQVNIITGEQGTGKSALIPIIEYCMGRKSPDIKLSQEIQDSIAWFAVLYQFDDMQLLVAKPPLGNSQSQSEAYLRIAPSVGVPSLEELVINSNDDAIRQEISQRLGIRHHVYPDESRTTEDYEVDISHARFFLFQDATIITSDRHLFHRQDDQFIPTTIKDSLPYFLGVYPTNYLSLINDKKRVAKELNKAQRQLEAARSNVQERVTRGERLIEEAKEVGLIDIDASYETDYDMFTLLASARNWRPENVLSLPDNRLPELQRRVRELYHQLDDVQFYIAQYQQYLADTNGYQSAVREQVNRLGTVSFFDDIDDENCPLCGNSIGDHLPSIQAIKRSLEKLESEANFAEHQRPELQAAIDQLRTDEADIKVSIQETEAAINGIFNSRQERVADKSLEDQTRHVVGRISYYIDITTTNFRGSEINDLESQVQKLTEQLEDIEKQLDPDQFEDAFFQIDGEIGDMMTQFAGELDVEYVNNNCWLDRRNLTVKIEHNKRVMSLRQIGSTGKNYLPYHIAALLALHSYFINHDRPVPGILVFDQPSSPYYPDDTYEDDKDRQQIRRIFRLLFQVAEQLSPNLQIIVLEHANEPEWHEALVEEPWRDGRALIPNHWFQ